MTKVRVFITCSLDGFIAGPNDELEWLGHLAVIGKEASDVFHRTSEFLADDGEIDTSEAQILLREVDELLAAVAAMRAAVRRRLGP